MSQSTTDSSGLPPGFSYASSFDEELSRRTDHDDDDSKIMIVIIIIIIIIIYLVMILCLLGVNTGANAIKNES